MGDWRGVRSGGRSVFCAAGTGLLLALAQPGVGIWPLVFICLLPLLVALRGERLARRLGLAWLAGTVAATVTAGLPVAVALGNYFGLAGWQVAAGSAAIGQVFGAMSFVLFAALGGDPARGHPAASALRIGAAWMAAELMRCSLFTGLPWGLLAYALSPVPWLAASAGLGGALLVSAWIAVVNALLASLVADRRRVAVSAAPLGGLVALVLLHAAAVSGAGAGEAGEVRPLDAATVSAAGAARIVLVQGNIPKAERRDPTKLVASMRRLAALEGADARADLVVWPENAVGAVLPFNALALRHALGRSGRAGSYRLLGAPRADRQDPGRIHNSAVLLDSDLNAVAHHDKVVLLPFAEFVPWPFAGGGFEMAPGARPKVLRAGEITLGPVICYEVLFAGVVRSLVQDGAGLVVNVSNDSWFGTTSGLDQHLAAAILRAIEFERPLLRSTSTGVTAAIDARGNVVAQLPRGEPGALHVAVTPGDGLTLYARIGDVPAWTALLVTSMLALRDLRAGRRQGV